MVEYYTGVEIRCGFEMGYWIEDSPSGRAMVAALHRNVRVSQHARDLMKRFDEKFNRHGDAGFLVDMHSDTAIDNRREKQHDGREVQLKRLEDESTYRYPATALAT